VLPQLNLHLYSRPPSAQPATVVIVDGRSLATIRCTDLEASRYLLSFEEAAEAIAGFERMFFEMDGSFVWTGGSAPHAWQLDGMLYDRENRVQRIELKGNCTLLAWQQLLRAFGWPDQAIVAQLIDFDCFVDANELSAIWSQCTDD
jgi:hypothetical protein